MTIQECYIQMGADYQEVSERLGNDARIEKYLGKFMKDGSYIGLCRALADENKSEAFAFAHSLKGQCLNLSLTNLSKASGALCESLRSEALMDGEQVAVMLADVKKSYEEAEAAVAAFMQTKEA